MDGEKIADLAKGQSVSMFPLNGDIAIPVLAERDLPALAQMITVTDVRRTFAVQITELSPVQTGTSQRYFSTDAVVEALRKAFQIAR